MKETIEHNNRFYGEELKTESEQLKEWLIVANKEIERLNNIIEETTNYIDKMSYADIVDNPKKDLVKILKRVDKE